MILKTKNKKGLDLPEPKLQTKLNFFLIILVVDFGCLLFLPTTYQDLVVLFFVLYIMVHSLSSD